jgi:cyclophilin family peptidyl-prolyl cis-trans isomerase
MAPKYNRKKPVQYKPRPKSGNSKKTLLIIVSVVVIVLIIAGVYFAGGFGTNANPQTSPTPTATPAPSPTPATNQTRVLLQTSMGNITLEMFDDKPVTTQNFLNLVSQGRYDGTVFHRIMDGFMIQGGAVSGTVTAIPDEIGSHNRNEPYTIAMAKTDAPNSATSQFFINLVDNGPNVIDVDGTTFDQTYTAFGKVVEGQSVVDAIAKVPVTPNTSGEKSVPTETVTVISATILS